MVLRVRVRVRVRVNVEIRVKVRVDLSRVEPGLEKARSAACLRLG